MKALSILKCVLFFAVLKTVYPVNSNEVKVEKLSFCDENVVNQRDDSKRHIYVTTLDGRLSTLDVSKGSIQWSILTEPGDLLSSSMSSLELTSNGKNVRMIPSLSGGIYKFDGDSIEAIPVTAEDLLKSSFKFTDDTVISGGKEVRNYGINTRTGRVQYECGSSGCKNQNLTDLLDENHDGSSHLLDDILVVKRQTQTVRAIEPRTGNERWNFSIANLELELLYSQNCQLQREHEDEADKIILDMDLRIIVPDGIICGYSKSNPDTVIWKQTLDAPIVSVHRINNENSLYNVDLFKNVQWLWRENHFFKSSLDSKVSPSIYLGIYQQQLYIQESESMKASIDHHRRIDQNIISSEGKFLKIPFKPYSASNTAIAKLENGDTDKAESQLEGDKKNQKTQIVMSIDENAKSVMYASQFTSSKGYFLYNPDDYNRSVQCPKKTRSTNDFDNITFKNHVVMTKNSSMWDYWKEISVIALTTAFIINMMLSNRKQQEAEVVYVPVPYAREAMEYDEEQKRMENEIQAKVRSVSPPEPEINSYSSRFLSDFDMERVLGKGGFGVVFECKNHLDGCTYAIKRILLPSKKESRERVMREVKTLANCEHRNIVRYFHAWVETPPKGWQEQKDKFILKQNLLSTSITIESPSPTEESKAFIKTDDSENVSFSTTSPWSAENQDLQNHGSVQNKNFQRASTLDDSGSFSIQFKAESSRGVDNKRENSDESFKIEFMDSRITSTSDSICDESRVISMKANDTDSSLQKPFCSSLKNHKRQMSLDIPSVSNLKPKKIAISVPDTGKMYLYIQMQLCMKSSLKDWLQTNSLEMRQGKTYEVWNQIIEAVHYVHLKGLIHRDLKPSNIFFALDGNTIKIGDFGLVTDMADIPSDSLTSLSNSSSSNVTHEIMHSSQKKHTQRVGTSLYMSPEQSKGLQYSYKVDIFSLGLILFELLNFFTTESERFKVLDNIRKHIYPKEFMENFDQEYELLKLMLSECPEERPTTYGIFSRPPLNKIDDQPNFHFELPSRRKESYSSQTSLNR